jgi:uncharacterized repeat protein (TIGR01451 family)
MRKRARRGVVAALLASAVMATIIPAASAAEFITIHGRRAVVHTSGATSTHGPTAKWTATSYGEHHRDTKGEDVYLRGRAAAAETFGVKRAWVSDVKLQAYIGGVWKTIAHNPKDVIDGRETAWAVQYTPKARYCPTNEALRRTWRVVNSHGIRRSRDNVIVNRVSYSHNFVAPAPTRQFDPTCPNFTQLDASVTGPEQLTVGEKAEYTIRFENPAQYGESAPDPVASVTIDDGLVGTEVGSDVCEPMVFEEDYDWVTFNCDLGETFEPGDVRTMTWELEAVAAKDHQSIFVAFESETKSWATPDFVTHGIEVLPPEVDLSLSKSLPSNENTDVDPTVPGMQVHPGDLVTYRFNVSNNSQYEANAVTLIDDWPLELESALGNTSPSCFVSDDGDVKISCELGEFGYMAPGATDSVFIQGRVRDDLPVGTEVTNTAQVEATEPDPTAAIDTARFEVVAID